MIKVYDLNEENCQMLSIKAYDNKSCLMSEFEADFQRISYIKRLFGKYKRNNELKEQLILNHIIVLGNVFSPELATKLLFLKVEEEYYPVLKTFLLYLNYLPEYINSIKGQIINTKVIPVDLNIAEHLRKL